MGKSKKTKWVYLVLGSCIPFLCWEFYQNHEVELRISSGQGENVVLTMPRKDKKSLDYFFRKVFEFDSGLYTLFGCKPMSMTSFYIPFSTTNLEIFLCSLSPRNLRVYWGWKTWQKYQDLLSHSEFVLWAEENPFWSRWGPPPNPSIAILLIHKQKFQEEIEKNIEDFQTVLGTTAINIDELLKKRPFMKLGLKDHDGLIGTLFGFGRDNAWLFEERNQGKNVYLLPVWDKEINDFFKNRPTPNWIVDELDSIEISTVLGYPCFMADIDSFETRALKMKFIDAREKILNYYKNKDFFETTLNLLTSGVLQD